MVAQSAKIAKSGHTASLGSQIMIVEGSKFWPPGKSFPSLFNVFPPKMVVVLLAATTTLPK